jgi:hypothetical protein
MIKDWKENEKIQAFPLPRVDRDVAAAPRARPRPLVFAGADAQQDLHPLDHFGLVELCYHERQFLLSFR